MSINRVVISGNLTRDPELRQTAGGMQILGFGVAVNDRRKNQQTGEWEDCPNFIDCTMFGNRAQSVSRFLSKGSKVAIEGKLRWSQWERDGQKRSKIEVIVDVLELMQRQDVFATAAQPAHASAAAQVFAPAVGEPMQQQMPGMPQPVAASIYDEDLPF